MNKPESTENVSKFQVPGKTKLIKGSILQPHNAGLRFILNVANMAGKMESPLYPILDKKWPKVKQEVRGWYATKTGEYKFGAVNTTSVQSDIWVLNCLVQDEKLKTDSNAVEKCLKEVCRMAKYEKATVHVSTTLIKAVPEFKKALETQLISQGVSVYYYEEA